MRSRRSLKNPYKASVQVILKFDNKIKFVKFVTFKVCSTADIFNGCSSRLVGSNSGILVVYLWSPSGLTQVVNNVVSPKWIPTWSPKSSPKLSPKWSLGCTTKTPFFKNE